MPGMRTVGLYRCLNPPGKQIKRYGLTQPGDFLLPAQPFNLPLYITHLMLRPRPAPVIPKHIRRAAG